MPAINLPVLNVEKKQEIKKLSRIDGEIDVY